MTQGFHKVKPRALRAARALKYAIHETAQPSIIISLGIEKVSEIIKLVTKENEDAFQDTWLAIIGDHVGSEDDILRIAKEINHRYANKQIYEGKQFISLNEPIGPHKDEGDFTWADVLPTPTEEETGEYYSERSYCDIKMDSNSHYGPITLLEDLINKEYKLVCKYCNSAAIIKYGRYIRRTKEGLKYTQNYFCLTCRHKFTPNGALPHMKFPRYIIREVIRMRLNNCSLSDIAQSLYDRYKIRVGGKSTILKWLRKANIEPPLKTNKWRRDSKFLAERLRVTFKQGTNHPASSLLRACNYSNKTKIEDTQIFKLGMILRRNGGFVINDTLYEEVGYQNNK